MLAARKDKAKEMKDDPTAITTLDLGIEELKDSELEALQSRVSAAIANDHKIAPRWIAQNSDEVAKIRCRGLPENVVGPLRVLEIDGIDINLCCGTHVKTTAHLRAVKLLCTERVRDRGKTHTRLHFVAGGRLLATLGAAYDRQLQLNNLLAVKPEEHATCVETMLAARKDKAKEMKDDPTAITTLDLGIEELKDSEFEALQSRVSAAIANDHKIAPRWIAQNSDEVAKIRCRGLPENV